MLTLPLAATILILSNANLEYIFVVVVVAVRSLVFISYVFYYYLQCRQSHWLPFIYVLINMACLSKKNIIENEKKKSHFFFLANKNYNIIYFLFFIPISSSRNIFDNNENNYKVIFISILLFCFFICYKMSTVICHSVLFFSLYHRYRRSLRARKYHSIHDLERQIFLLYILKKK